MAAKPFIRLALLALFLPLANPSVCAQGRDWSRSDLGGFTGENNGRSLAVKKVLPVYPAEAVRQGVEGVVEVMVGWNDQGEVERVKAPPGLNPLLRDAAAAAARAWTFKPLAQPLGAGKYFTHRLTFHFIIEQGVGRVELFNPPWDSKAGQRLRDYGSKNITEWEHWEDAIKKPFCRGESSALSLSQTI